MQLWVNRYKRTPPPLPLKQELFLEAFFAVGISNASCYFLGVFFFTTGKYHETYITEEIDI